MKTIYKSAKEEKKTFGECFEEFMQEKQVNGLSKSTLRNYGQSCSMFMDYFSYSYEKPIEEIKLKDFYKWIQHMKENEVRVSSINHYLRDWRTFLNWCGERGYCEVIKIKELEKQEELPKMYTDEEMDALLQKPRNNDSFSEWRTWCIVNLVYSTGLRASTVCNLKLDDINFSRGELAIEKQKNKKAGLLPITPALETVLREYIRKWGVKNYLFPNVGDEQMTVNGLRQALRRYCEGRGVAAHGIHSIRHNFARDMILNGGGEYRLQKYLQHSSIQMSQHYVKLFTQDLKKDADAYNPLDRKKISFKRKSVYKK